MLNIQVHPRTGEAFIPEGGGAAPRAAAGTPQRPLWEMRTEEQAYAKLPMAEPPAANHWGQTTDLTALSGLPERQPLFINEHPAVGEHPNRHRQHAFFFNADNCIGCHACEAACSEKNENPAHLAFRSVGYLEGGSWPDFKRLNISMACNHCDDPVCLRGCPTKAYTKHSAWGAVLQDPETCFGCGYCTWVCPYNAPQLDPVKGQVSKCNMCVDRLEVGLKPACVAACVGNALDFGVVDSVPARREQAQVAIPGFPDPSITHPNVRFQQVRELPDELRRTDSMPIKYVKDAQGGYRPVMDAKPEPGAPARAWNLRQLSSRENPLVAFTLGTQAAVGGFALAFVMGLLGGAGFAPFAAFAGLAGSGAYFGLLAAAFALVAGGLFMSTLHLGKPRRFYRGFNNLRHSPVSREGLGIALFIAALGAHGVLGALALPTVAGALPAPLRGLLAALQPWLAGASTAAGGAALLAGAGGLYYMVRCYRIPARPFWNHWQVASSFAGSALALGAALAAALLLPGLDAAARAAAALPLVAAMFAGVALEGVGLLAHARAMDAAPGEGAAAMHRQCTHFGHSYLARNTLLGLNLLLLAAVAAGAVLQAGWALPLLAAVALLQLGAALVGRALFYVLVIPTTMPGAFFWKNKGFEDHARASGLAAMPQVGVAPLRH